MQKSSSLQRGSVLEVLLWSFVCQFICSGGARLTHFVGSHAQSNPRLNSSKTSNYTQGVPRILHQSWKTAAIPRKFKHWQQTWIDLHPGWDYKLWTDETNRRFVQEQYGWFLDTYDDFPTEIMRADSVRYLYLHCFGGLYVDLDFLALRSNENLLRGQTLVLGALSNDTKNLDRVPNAWMASAPGHPFWMYCTQGITKAYQSYKASKKAKPYVENVTGPVMLSRAIAAYERSGAGDMTILPPGTVYPADWRDSHEWGSNENEMRVCNPYHLGFDEVQCIGKFRDAYALTFWTKSWTA